MALDQRPRWPAIVGFVVAVVSLASFIYLNQKMAPPYPRNQTNSVSGATNAAKPSP